MENFELPMYFIVGIRPIKFVRTENNDLTVLKLNFDTGEFEQGMEFYTKCLFDAGGEVREVTEEQFIQQVEKVRGRYLTGEGPVFALYELVKGFEETAEQEGRRLTSWEKTLIQGLRKETHKMFEEELKKRRAASSENETE